MPIGLLIALLAAGAVTGLCWLGTRLTWSGLRGDLIDRHPCCRTCEYDLTGHDVRPERCPECSADLRGPNTVRVGHRRVNGARVGLGLAVLAAAIGPVGYVSFGATSAVVVVPAPPAAAPAPAPLAWSGVLREMDVTPRRATAPPVRSRASRDAPDDAADPFDPLGALTVPMVARAPHERGDLGSSEPILLFGLGDRVGDTAELKRHLNPRLYRRGGQSTVRPARLGANGVPRPTARPVGRATGGGAFR